MLTAAATRLTLEGMVPVPQLYPEVVALPCLVSEHVCY